MKMYNTFARRRYTFSKIGETKCKVYCLFHSSYIKRKGKRGGSCVEVHLCLLRGQLDYLS